MLLCVLLFNFINILHQDPDRVALAQQTVYKQARGPPLQTEEWINCFDIHGRLHNINLIREKIYHGVQFFTLH